MRGDRLLTSFKEDTVRTSNKSWTCASALLAGCAGLAVAGPAGAQSSYAMTVLKPGAVDAATPLQYQRDAYIDSQDRVLGDLIYDDGLKPVIVGFNGVFPKFRLEKTFSHYVVRYAASSAASVSPVKVLTKSAYLALVSPGGLFSARWAVPAANNTVPSAEAANWVSVPTPQGQPIGYFSGEAIQAGPTVGGSGVVLQGSGSSGPWVHQLDVPTVWSSAGGWRYLPQPAGYQGGRVFGLNSRGEAVGEVYAVDDLRPAAVRWTAAGAELMPAPSGQAATALALSDQGHVLKATRAYSISGAPGNPTSPVTVMGIHHWSVSFNGQDTALTCTAAGLPHVQAFDMSATGVVVGRCGSYPSPFDLPFGSITQTYTQNLTSAYPKSATLRLMGAAFTPAQSRAFIWQNGVMTDLTAWVVAKGLKLPAGTVFTNAVSINAKGSIVAEYIDAAGKYALVRLTATP
jgi:hypothetical protein